MTGLDFEELDKAVQAAMGSRNTSASDIDDTISPVSTTTSSVRSVSPAVNRSANGRVVHDILPPPSPASSQKSSSLFDGELAAVETADAPSVKPIGLIGNRGKFMDVKQPASSGVSGATKATDSAQQVARTSGYLEPLHPSVEPLIETASVHDAIDQNVIDADNQLVDPAEEWPDIEELDPSLDDEPSSSDSEQPDVKTRPLNDTQAIHQGQLTEEAQSQKNEVNDAHSTDTTETTDDTLPNKATLFVTNPQIEKRPLGQPKQAVQEEPVVPPKPAEVVSEPANKIDEEISKESTQKDNASFRPPVQDVPALAPLPTELRGDLLEIEAEHDNDGESEPKPEQPSTPVIEKPKMATASAQPSSLAAQVAHQSLPPRPDAKPETAESGQAHESMYATAAYPHTVAVKHSTGWHVPLIIAILLVVGAIGGIIVYLMTTR